MLSLQRYSPPRGGKSQLLPGLFPACFRCRVRAVAELHHSPVISIVKRPGACREFLHLRGERGEREEEYMSRDGKRRDVEKSASFADICLTLTDNRSLFGSE